MLGRAAAGVVGVCLATGLGAQDARAAPVEVWECTSASAAGALRRLDFDHATGEASMMVGDERYRGRFTMEHRHLAAVFTAPDPGAPAQELTLGLGTGRVIAKLRMADGSRPVDFSGVCRVVGGAT